MNLKHGFDSKNNAINPDNQLMNSVDLTTNQLAYAERFLHGISVNDPIRAHEITKIIYKGGRFKYSSLFKRAEKYIQGYEYKSLEKLSQLEKDIKRKAFGGWKWK